MTVEHEAVEYNLSAANLHALAARNHEEASRHYQLGEDDIQATQQALVAIGHAWQAIDHAKQANRFYVGQDAALLQKYLEPVPRFLEKPFAAAGTIETTFSRTEHHARAADHHEQAARHHSRASLHCSQLNWLLAAHEARFAHGHAHHSIFHGIEAAKHYFERQANNQTGRLAMR